MKPIASKRFYFSMHERLYWSDAYQALNRSALNLMMCFYAELRWSGKGKKRVYTNNGEISFSEAEFKANKLGASGTYLNARNQLIKVGFIKVTYRGGMARGDMNKYKLLWVDGVFHHEMRWKRFPNENWEHEIPKVKDYAVGRETRFKKINNTLKDKTLNGTNPPNGLDPINVNPPKEQGSNS
jgi:hypothetical protein